MIFFLTHSLHDSYRYPALEEILAKRKKRRIGKEKKARVHFSVMTEGTSFPNVTVSGNLTCEEFLESEKRLEEKYGHNVICQIYRVKPSFDIKKHSLPPRMTTIPINGDHIAGTDTVKDVKKLIQQLLTALKIDVNIPVRNMTCCVNGKVMQEDALFYADHRLMLPCWIQVLIT